MANSHPFAHCTDVQCVPSVLVGDTRFSPYRIFQLYSEQLDSQSVSRTMNTCATGKISQPLLPGKSLVMVRLRMRDGQAENAGWLASCSDVQF